uniref:Uncharacterized protein n=1 Tax=Pipistrellus kuhlii TaxID=59472 RepID=A0A7J7VMM7_PIPKU|nr:hypothetical protein mPipKuh1_008417 [Pipistrellus kuhlii]
MDLTHAHHTQDTATYWQDSLLCFQTCHTLEAHLWVFLNLGVFCSTPWEQLNMGTGGGEWGDNRLIPVAQGTTCANSTHQVRQSTNLCCRGREKLPKNLKKKNRVLCHGIFFFLTETLRAYLLILLQDQKQTQREGSSVLL